MAPKLQKAKPVSAKAAVKRRPAATEAKPKKAKLDNMIFADTTLGCLIKYVLGAEVDTQ